MPVEKQIVIIWIATRGFLDDVKKEEIAQFEEEFLCFIDEKFHSILEKIKTEKKISESLFQEMEKSVLEFKKNKM